MNPEQQRIAIAEACGWRECWINQNGEPWGFLGALHYSQSIPKYLNDLNAMHEAEKSLTADQARAYDKEQQKIGFRERLAGAFWVWHLPANWKAEAFLRTIGKWEEAK